MLLERRQSKRKHARGMSSWTRPHATSLIIAPSVAPTRGAGWCSNWWACLGKLCLSPLSRSAWSTPSVRVLLEPSVLE
eukprot:6378215-Alexandrium_andersonii.AAC.1